jgi:NAD(P)H dehydrogenase (quinone)
MTTAIAITAATGALGGRVARRLAARGVTQRLVVRDPARAPELAGATVVAGEYGDGASMREALAGIDTLLFVSATETEDRVARHLSAVDAAAAAGVRRIVYTSFVNAGPEATFLLARHHWQTEEHIRASGLAFTFLRDSLYADVLPFFVGADGVIRGPAGDGRGSFVTRDDIADAAVAVLLNERDERDGHDEHDEHDGHDGHDGRTYDLSGPQSLSFTDVAAILSARSGREVRYHAETVEEAYASRAQYGAPEWMVDGWVSTYTAAAKGELDLVTDHVERLTGRPATSFDAFVAGDEEGLRHLRSLGR